MDKAQKDKTHTRKKLGLAIAAILLPALAAAQEARMLEEVIVTAQKRSESVQDVPLGVTALSADKIANAGIVNTGDLVKLAPSLTAVENQNKQSSSFSIRGVGTNVFSIGVETSVAVVIDEVSTVQAGQSLANLFDIERIEVLRGPQSTLFGKSASAGLINVTTKGPSQELEGSLELAATDDNETRVNAVISGPITDRLGYRLSGYWNDLDEGWVDNLTYNNEINDTESKGVRGKLRWDITDTIQADLNAYYDEDNSTCCALTWEILDPEATVFGVPGLGPVASGIKPSDENRDVRTDDVPESDTENTGADLRLSFGLGDFTLTSITAYNNWQYDNVQDVDLSDVDVFGFYTGGVLSGGFVSTSQTESDFFSQELRLESPAHDSYDYLLGLYYADAETDRNFLRNPGLPILPSDWDATAETETLAMFGQFNWHLSERTHINAGLRWNDEEISIDYVDNLSASPANNSDSDTKVLGNLSLQYYLADEVMLYARYAQGYKGQAFNVVTGFTQEDADNPVDPETSDSYELGFRSTLWDQRLQLNTTLFYTEYDDFQAQNTIVTPEGNFINKLRNVGEVETQGLEIDGIVLLGDNLTVTFAASYTDTEIKSFQGAPCYASQTEATGCVDGTQDLDGESLPNAPEWKYNLGADYHLELASMPFYGFFNIGYTWQDDINFALTRDPFAEQDSYGIGSASIGINERDSDLYRVTLFVNNFTDESYSGFKVDSRQIFGGKDAIVQNLPRGSQRYYGIRVKFNF